MTTTERSVWQHRPATGPVAWGAAVLGALAAPVPLGWSWIVLGFVDAPSPAMLAAAAWLVVGLLLALVPHRLARGAGLGLATGMLTCGLVLLAVTRT